MSAHARRRGFTLLELMVVLALLALTALAVVPAFAGEAQRTPERVTATALADLLRAARDDARERGAASSVTLEPRDGRWWLQLADSTRTGRLELPALVQLDADGEERVDVRFDPTGRATATTIVVRGTHPLDVRVNGWTGEITVVEHTR